MASKKNVVVIEFKNPDFDSELADAGVDAGAVRELRGKALFGEYWAVELTMCPTGEITHARFIKGS